MKRITEYIDHSTETVVIVNNDGLKMVDPIKTEAYRIEQEQKKTTCQEIAKELEEQEEFNRKAPLNLWLGFWVVYSIFVVIMAAKDLWL